MDAMRKEESKSMFKRRGFCVIFTVLFTLAVSAVIPAGMQIAVAEDNTAEEIEETEDIIESEPVTVPVPIYNYDIASVVVPTSYTVALNPYELPIKASDGTVSVSQVVSQNYGIVNKSTRDKLVTVTLKIKDENEGKIVFVGSKEEALKADKDIYAVYLSVVPSDNTGIKINGEDADKDTSAEALTSVTMNKAEDSAVALKEGDNFISFRLYRAVYEFGGNEEIEMSSSNVENIPELARLAEDNGGVTAFTFDGAMNPNADWAKLSKGVNISVTYSYENAMGDETIVDGTGAMIVNQ